ncbi:MAG: hypothetical protein KAJ56_01465 [Candidatus Aenigmarchaeota archaeon]|nr:hypothetical protein [Candidatus Aenigmarchaeota archaeon]
MSLIEVDTYGVLSLSDETPIDFKEPLNWGAVLGDRKYNPYEGFDALDYLFGHLRKIKVFEKYVFSEELFGDLYSDDGRVDHKMEKFSDLVNKVSSYSLGQDCSNDLMKFLYMPLYKIREDYVFVKHFLSLDSVDISDDALERTESLFGFYWLDVLPAGEGSIKRKLVYNPPENESDEPYFKIEKPVDVLLCLPVDVNHNYLSIDLSVLQSYLDEDDITTFVNRNLIKIVNGNNNNKVSLTSNGSFVRRTIFNRKKDKISDLLVPREFLRPESPIKIGELIGSDSIK